MYPLRNSRIVQYNSGIGGQSRNSYLAQANSGIVPIPTMCRRYISLYMKKQYKSSIIKNHETAEKRFFGCVSLKGYVAS